MTDISPATIKAVSERAICLFSGEQVRQALDVMAASISERLADHNPILLCVMTGGIVTASELALRLKFPLQIDYIHASRYRNQTRGSDLHWLREPSLPLRGRAVLVVDDILDEGATLEAIVDHCREAGASLVESAVLVHKHHERKLSEIAADYVGLQAEDRYLFGYGMDYRGYLRNADGIFAVHEDDI